MPDQAGLVGLEDTIPAAVWAKSIIGIGPVMAAGLAAHIDISECPTVGRIWRFAGLDPTVEWKEHGKRPWNASLKSLCGKIGESFAKVSGHERDVYGKLYIQRKALEQARNAAGKLPATQIDARAKRWTVKLFLAHYHEVAWTIATGAPPPKPYAIARLDLVDYQDLIKPQRGM